MFRIGPRVIPHGSDKIVAEYNVSVDFGDQKPEIKDETVTQDSNGDIHDDLEGLNLTLTDTHCSLSSIIPRLFRRL